MNKKEKVIYVLSYVLFPLTAVILLLGYWIEYPSICKRNKIKNREEK